MVESWFVLRCKPHKEAFLAEQLRMHGFGIFNPHIRVQRVNPRARTLRPYFPGYVFVRIDPERVNLSTLQWMPGSVGLVSFGGEPACVPDGLVQAIRRKVEAVHSVDEEYMDRWKAGELLVVHSGPFSGCEAIFDTRASGDERAKVLLKLLSNRQVRLELPADQIRRKVVGYQRYVQSIS